MNIDVVIKLNPNVGNSKGVYVCTKKPRSLCAPLGKKVWVVARNHPVIRRLQRNQ